MTEAKMTELKNSNTGAEQDSRSTQTPEQAQRNRRRNRWTLFALLLVFLSPTIFALFWRPEGRVNFGELIQPPVPMVEVALDAANGTAANTGELREKWLWLTVVRGSCTEECRQNLYNMRQARIAEGKYSKRIRYAVLVLDPATDADAGPDEQLVAEHPVMDWFTARDDAAAKLGEQFLAASGKSGGQSGGVSGGKSGGTSDLDHEIYIVDPLGNIMMRYPKGTDGRPLKKDLSRLLRASHVG